MLSTLQTSKGSHEGNMQSNMRAGKSPLGAPSTWSPISPTPWRGFHSASLFPNPLFPSLWKKPQGASPLHLPRHTRGSKRMEGGRGGGGKEEIGGCFQWRYYHRECSLSTHPSCTWDGMTSQVSLEGLSYKAQVWASPWPITQAAQLLSPHHLTPSPNLPGAEPQQTDQGAGAGRYLGTVLMAVMHDWGVAWDSSLVQADAFIQRVFHLREQTTEEQGWKEAEKDIPWPSQGPAPLPVLQEYPKGARVWDPGSHFLSTRQMPKWNSAVMRFLGMKQERDRTGSILKAGLHLGPGCGLWAICPVLPVPRETTYQLENQTPPDGRDPGLVPRLPIA